MHIWRVDSQYVCLYCSRVIRTFTSEYEELSESYFQSWDLVEFSGMEILDVIGAEALKSPYKPLSFASVFE